MRLRPPLLRFAASAFLTLAAALGTLPAAAQQRVGVNAAVNTDAHGLPPGGAIRKLVIGQEVVHNERITTDAKGQTQILFLDGSSISVGPNADLIIDEFVYDPATGTGKMTLTEIQGAMRFVGGKLSKQENAVTLHLGTATIGVRGGVFVADVQPGGKTEIVFVYGKAVSVSGQSGCSQQLYRPGFAVDIDKPGGCPGAPYQAPPGTTVAILAQLDGRAGGNGGASTVPTDATVANSSVPNTVSNNIQVSIQQAGSNTPANPLPPAPAVNPPQVPLNQIQVASSQTQPFVASPTPPPPPLPPPPTTGISGAFKDAFTTNTGFTPDATSVTTFTATIAYPNPPQNGTLNATATGGGFTFAMSPLTPGKTTQVMTPASIAGVPTGNSANGPATMTADGDFFFANTVAGGGDLVFFFGGTPVSQNFYAAQPTSQILAFNVQPDYALANGSLSQTIPFLPSFAGGTLANPVVSPLYIVTAANNPFGAFNATSNPGITSPRFLQASLAINGSGPTQDSALVVNTGVFATANAGGVYADGIVRGAVLTGSTGMTAPTRIGSSIATVSDGSGNALFGGNTLDGFVLDQNQFSNGNPVQQSAVASPFSSDSTATTYGFNQPVLATTLPAGIGASRTTQSLIGFAAGTVFSSATSPYALAGVSAVITNAVNNRVAATFALTDPFTASVSGASSISLQFGGLTATADGNRSAFIDDNTFAAVDSASTPSQVSGNNLPIASPGQPGTRIAMVTSGTVPGAANGLFQAAGATPCQCAYLQWGYWTGESDVVNSDGALIRVDRANIGTWIAGQPTVTMPTVGTGMYSGAAIGSVVNNGQSYMAAGQFSNTYNFGNNTGMVAINNFDGHNYSGTVAGSAGSPIYAGTIAGGHDNRQGILAGSFYGPGAAETGGTFAVQATSGPSYIASGIFAGKLNGPIH